MEELRVPVARIPADVLLTDGRTFSGVLFVPTVASRHEGQTYPDELLNEPASFFPFLPAEGQGPVLLCKAQVAVITVPAWTDDTQVEDPDVVPARRARFELAGRTVEGTVVIDMPEHQGRMLDYLNFSGPFVTVRDGDRRHLVHKAQVLRVVEVKGA